jgi:hypothetical protein
VALLAIPLIAWFALIFHNDLLAGAASERILEDPGMSAADWNRAMDDLRRAELLDPGSERRMVRAQYLLLRDKREAARVATSVLGREPDNLDAWWVVLRATDRRDPERAARAAEEIRRLNPPPSRVRR